MDRRRFLTRSGMALGATLALPAMGQEQTTTTSSLDTWADIRSQFKFDPAKVPMSQMLLASHPKWVSDAIEKYRALLDANPVEYWEENWLEQETKMRKSVAAYLKADPEEVALTDSTTMGLGTLYTGLALKAGDEILTTTHDHYSTEKSLEFAAQKNQAIIKRNPLFKDASTASVDEILGNLSKGIGPKTRIIAVTWVHSSSGMKLPIRAMADTIKKVNAQRGSSDRIYFCVDGVHGFGVDNVTMEDLGCDFFAAGAHKWIFGPCGTGILWGKRDAWDMVVPTIPAFSSAYAQWLGLISQDKLSFSELNSPGGFHSFEHRWALTEAFDFHMKVGKDKIEGRTHQLSTMLKAGMKEMKHVKLHTPVTTQLSAGINCFEVNGMKPDDVVKKFLENKIIANSSPYKISYARLTPSIVNSEEDVNACLRVLEKMKA